MEANGLGGLLMVVVEKVGKNVCLLVVSVPGVGELDTEVIEGKERSRGVWVALLL